MSSQVECTFLFTQVIKFMNYISAIILWTLFKKYQILIKYHFVHDSISECFYSIKESCDIEFVISLYHFRLHT